MMFLQVYFAVSVEDDIDVPGYFKWIHVSVARVDLLCPDCCSPESTNPCLPIFSYFSTDKSTICCVANAVPFWKFNQYSHLRAYWDLGIDYEQTTGRPFVYDKYSRNLSYYDLDYQHGHLSYFPDNICKFSNIVWLNFSSNVIENITDLSCLNLLDTLDLSHNRIQTVESSAFSGLPNLRYLYLFNNLISVLEPKTFKYRPGSLRYVDFGMNRIVSVDVTNVILGYFFHTLDYSHNKIRIITNLLQWRGFKEEEMLGGGWINLENNNFTRLPDTSKIGFENMHSVYRVCFNYHIVLKKNPWQCDCHAYAYINIFLQAALNFKVIGIDCAGPASLKGHSIQEFQKDKTLLHKLICKVTLKEKCPPKCNCFDQPSKNRVVVDCSYTNRSTTPKVVPKLDNLDIDLRNNKIEVFQHLDYLNRTTKIDLSFNRINVIEPTIFGVKNLKFIYLHHNYITEVDRSVQLMNPCNLWFGNLTLTKCNCEMFWIKLWLERQKNAKCEQHINMMTCEKGKKHVNLFSLSEQDLCPLAKRTNILYAWLLTTLFFIMGILMIYYNFRYEVRLLLRKQNIHINSDNNERRILHDVYLSFNVENSEVRHWTTHVLINNLEDKGYRVCMPPRDFEVGGTQMEQIHSQITGSRSFIVILNDDYLESQFQITEWNNIWNVYKTDRTSNLVIINYDILKSRNIHERKLKAFIRLGFYLDFSNLKKRLLKDIETKLGYYGKQSKHQESVYVFKTESVL